MTKFVVFAHLVQENFDDNNNNNNNNNNNTHICIAPHGRDFSGSEINTAAFPIALKKHKVQNF